MYGVPGIPPTVLPPLPGIGSLAAPAEVFRGAELTLNASMPANPIDAVRFYLDTNGNGTLQRDSDQLLATDADGSDGFSYTMPTLGMSAGTATFFATGVSGGQAVGQATASTEVFTHLRFELGAMTRGETNNTVGGDYLEYTDVIIRSEDWNANWTGIVDQNVSGYSVALDLGGTREKTFYFSEDYDIGKLAGLKEEYGKKFSIKPTAENGLAADTKLIVLEDWTDGDYDDFYWVVKEIPVVLATVSISTAYSDSLVIDDGNLVEMTHDGTAVYVTDVPFVVSAHLDSEATSAHLLRVTSTDEDGSGYSILYEDYLAPGQNFERVFVVSPGRANSAFVQASVLDPSTGDSVAQAEEEEPLVELDFRFNGITEKIQLQPEHVTEWARQGGDSLAGNIVSRMFNDTAITSLAKEFSGEDPFGGTVEMYEQKIRLNLLTLELHLKGQFHSLSDAAADELFDAWKPNWLIRIGQSDPSRAGASQFLNGLPGAAQTGMSRRLGAGDIAKNVGKFTSIKWISFGNFKKHVGPENFREFLKTGDITKIPNELWKTLPIIKSVGLKVPLVFDPAKPGFNGNLWIGVEDVSLDGIGTIDVTMGAKTSGPVKVGNWEIDAALSGSLRYDPDTGKAKPEAGLKFIAKPL